MYICVCNAVTERHIEDAVANGARRLRDLRVHLGVSAECGRCASCAHQCLKVALDSGPNSALDQLAARAMQALPPLPSLEMEAT